MSTTPHDPSNGTDLFRTAIPGGFATWWHPDELPPRRKRELDIAGQMTAPGLRRAVEAVPDLTADNIEDLPLEAQAKVAAAMSQTKEETRELFAMNELLAWCYLKSWTLTSPVFGPPNPTTGEAPVVARVPRELPATPDDILDLERDLYDALLRHSARIRAEYEPMGFTVDSVENPASPTGASDG